MTIQPWHDVLEATGYLTSGGPAHGVHLDEDARGKCRTRDFRPDALWRSESSLTVYFKVEQEVPSDDQVAGWRREIWNQGFAPLLWVISPEKIDIYNGFGLPQKTGDADKHRLRTFERIESELDELDAFAGRLAMETGRFWQEPLAHRVDRKTCVDQRLLSDLAALERNLVDAGMSPADAQELIGRSIFTQYLIDRQIVKKRRLERDYRHQTLSAILRDRQATERLFVWLRETFNGDMFPSQDSSAPSDNHLNRVADFLEAVDPKSGQTTLFPYQFDVIPVELISSIYEQFARSDSSISSGHYGTDVFYTRLPLVSLVLDEITEGLTGEETVLDLTCGSGVFLVEALRRLVRIRAGDTKPNRKLIRSTLHEQIYGVDISEAAIRVAAFSLYLAALELDPHPQPPQELTFKPLIGKTLIVGDAQNAGETLTVLTEQVVTKKFDVIIGNPPWSYRGREATAARRHESDRDKAHAPRGESLGFVSRAMDFASDSTRFGLILSAVQFFSRSGTGATASRQLIEKLSPVTLVNLSNQSNWLFSNANMPAVVLFARHRPTTSDTITTVQVPWSPVGARSHTFEMTPSDVVTLPLAHWKQKPEFLKTAFFGFRRDMALLDRLMSNHENMDKRLSQIHTQFRTGLKFGKRSRDASFLRDLPFLDTGELRPFFVPIALVPFDEARAEGPHNRDIYQAPLLIVQEVLRGGPRPVAAVADQDTVFRDAYFGAAFSREHREAAYMIAALLSSSLASWFFLMTASAFGLWKRRLLLRDIVQMPVPDLETAPRSNVGRHLIRLARKLQQRPPRDADWRTLDEAVFDLYGLDEPDRIVARDGLFRASWQWQAGRDESAKAADTNPHLMDYADTFLAAVDVWLAATKRCRMRAEVFDLSPCAPLRVIRFVLEERSGASVAKPVRPEGDLKGVLDSISQRLDVRLGTSLVGRRELRVYDHNEVVIIKPAARRHWMGVSALEDADAVIVESFTGGRAA